MPLSFRTVKTAEDAKQHRDLVMRIFPNRSAPARAREQSFKHGGRLEFLALLHGAPVGVGAILFGRQGPEGCTEILDIGLAPEHRRAGHGRRILMHLCAEAYRARPDQDIVITPHEANAAFYQMFGFEAEGPADSDDGEPRIRMRQRASWHAAASPIAERV